MGRDRKKHPKRNQYCLRLTDEQALLLQKYADFREFDSEVDAIRAMIDGLDDWFVRQQAKRSAGSAGTSDREQADSGRPAVNDVSGDFDAIDVASRSDVAADDGAVGDFAGRPSVRLPESRHDGFD